MALPHAFASVPVSVFLLLPCGPHVVIQIGSAALIEAIATRSEWRTEFAVEPRRIYGSMQSSAATSQFTLARRMAWPATSVGSRCRIRGLWTQRLKPRGVCVSGQARVDGKSSSRGTRARPPCR
jgi:hypothetical protein